MATQDYTYDRDYQILLRGYTVTVKPSEENQGYFTVTLEEAGAKVFERDLPSPEQVEEIGEAALNSLAQAAIDIYEAERGSLGMGAQAKKTKRKKSMKKKSYLDCWGEDWFMSFKNTPYEEQAAQMLMSYIDMEYQTWDDPELSDLYDRKREIEYELKKLNVERMKTMPAPAQIIVIQAKVAQFYEASDIEDYMEKFEGSPQEDQAVKLLYEYVQICEEINTREQASDASMDSLSEIRAQMSALSMEVLQNIIVEKLPTEGAGAFPNMAVDVAELMEGVSMDEPLIPMSGVLAKKAEDESEEDSEPREVVELGDYTEGLDPAEVEYPEAKTWNNGDLVSTKKEVEVRGWGTTKKFPKGTKGIVDDLSDKANLIYSVRLTDKETGKTTLARIPGNDLTKRSK